MSVWHFRGDSIRHEHALLRERLAEVESLVSPPGAGVPDRASACIVLRFFETGLGPHMDEEERALYPDLDRLVGGKEPFTSVLRREHRIIRRWIVHLQAACESGNLRLFARRAENLLGMVYAHMEAEDSIALPLVDFAVVPEAADGRRGTTGATGALAAPNRA